MDCPVTALVGDRDPQTTIDDASAWEGHTAAAFELRVLSGGHFFLDAHQAEVADVIATSLKG
ncbi:thioesterase II family protein [Allosalinactinospora lopnorensis]|uniref:thioesterase II family protein n=1 Tax=Allosalinactinospora lopnorensis TaxID=1352348 RepID=UPI00373FD864